MDSSFSAPESSKKHQQGRGDKAGVRCCVSAVLSMGSSPGQAQGGPGTGHALLSVIHTVSWVFHSLNLRQICNMGEGRSRISRINGSISAVDILT